MPKAGWLKFVLIEINRILIGSYLKKLSRKDYLFWSWQILIKDLSKKIFAFSKVDIECEHFSHVFRHHNSINPQHQMHIIYGDPVQSTFLIL